MIARRMRISGKVQGVWYRDSTVETARSLELTGWVRNRSDGSVEVLAIGGGDQVKQLIAACWEGSPNAVVRHVDVEEVEIEPLTGFAKRTSA